MIFSFQFLVSSDLFLRKAIDFPLISVTKGRNFGDICSSLDKGIYILGFYIFDVTT